MDGAERPESEHTPTASPAGAAAPRQLVVDLDLRSAVVLVAALLGLFALFNLAQDGRSALIWVAIGLLLALALDPLVTTIQRRFRTRRGIAVGLVFLAANLAAAALLTLVVPTAAAEARRFPDELPGVVDDLGSLPVVGPWLERNDAPERVRAWLADLPGRLSDEPQPLVALVEGVLGGALATFAVLLVTVTVLLDGRRLLRHARRLVPVDHRATFDTGAAIAYRTVGRYFAGSLFVATLAGLAVLVAGLVIGVPLTPLVALWAAATNLIPQIGGLLGGGAFVLLAFTDGAGTGLAALAVFLVYQQFENHVLQPTIVGRAVALSPPVTMMAALIGASAAGVPGAMVAVPFLGALKEVLGDVRRRNRPAGGSGAFRSEGPAR